MKTATMRSSPAFLLANGKQLPADSMQIKYATWGNPKNPAILICPSMSQSAYATDMPDEEDASKVNTGWWRQVVGAGDHFGIDTRKFYVISGAPLGSPFGTTSPITTNPETGEVFGPHFPQITPADMAATQALLLDHLKVDKVLAVVGGSMGGMQSLQFAAMFPDRYERLVSIAGTGQTPPSTVALRSVQRAAVMADPEYKAGLYERGEGPTSGMAVARMCGTIGYRSRSEFDKRFNWTPDQDVEDGKDGSFEVERYLQYQAKKFTSVVNYDANCYLLLSRAMDRMNLGAGFGSLEQGVARFPKGKEALLLSYDTDTLTPAKDMENLSSLLGSRGMHVHFEELKSHYGHDAFLIAREAMPINMRMKAFLEAACVNTTTPGGLTSCVPNGVHEVRTVVKDIHEH